MLLRFAVENFRSLHERQELSLTASSLDDKAGSVRRLHGFEHGVLTVAAIYGANASGKTNVLRALAFMDHAVEHSQRSWRPDGPIPFEPFRFAGKSDPSTFEIDFLIKNVRYRYGFSADGATVLREWLYAYPSGRRQLWFLREQGVKPLFSFGKQLSGENRAIESLTRANSLFLSAAAQNNHEQLLPVYQWFSKGLWFVTDERSAMPQQTAKLCQDETFKADVVRLLASADLGIIDLEISEEPFDSEFLDAVKKLLATMEKETVTDRTTGERPTVPPSQLRTRLRHRTSSSADGVALPSEEESAGTIAWLGLIGRVLKTLRNGGVLAIDELDASLHPLLALQLVRLFIEPETNPKNAQLIFNTHDTNLLDQSLLRRDQIWFVEKDEHGGSHLYPLTDFKPRKDENLERGYLQGRYGAIPYLRPTELTR